MGIAAVLTDLDGTLLDYGGVLGPEARSAVDELRRRGVPVIPLTSKTVQELCELLAELDLGGIGSFENGAGVVDRHRVDLVSNALPAEVLGECLLALADLSGLPLTPVHRLAPEELASLTGLQEARIPAMLARQWGLPFLAPADAGPELIRAASRLPALRLTRGGLFWHISGNHGKEDALELLLRKGTISRPIVGLGDAPNDAGFLALCDVPVLIPGAGGTVDAELAAAVPTGRPTAHPGGRGWAEAIRGLLGGNP